MSLLSRLPRATVFQRSLSLPSVRSYASAPASPVSSSSSGGPNAQNPAVTPSSSSSSCPAGTVLTGLNYLKGEPPVLAKPDEEYPAWLWELLTPSKQQPKAEDDGPGGRAEKRRLRVAHRQTLKDSNLFKAK